MSGHLTVHGANVKSKPLVISDWGPNWVWNRDIKKVGVIIIVTDMDVTTWRDHAHDILYLYLVSLATCSYVRVYGCAAAQAKSTYKQPLLLLSIKVKGELFAAWLAPQRRKRVLRITERAKESESTFLTSLQRLSTPGRAQTSGRAKQLYRLSHSRPHSNRTPLENRWDVDTCACAVTCGMWSGVWYTGRLLIKWLHAIISNYSSLSPTVSLRILPGW